MADAEFEEFRQSYEKVSWQSKIPAPFYSLVPDVSEETSPTYSNCDPKTDCDSVELSEPTAKASEGLSSRNEASGGCVSVFSRTGERRRRKLPEIPKHIRASLPCRPHQLTLHSTLPSLEWDSPDSERPLTDADSGHSTAHSPEMPKSLSPIFQPPHGQLCQHVDMLEATHRGLHKFIPRHDDEVEVEIGDPLYVAKEMDDLWCEGVNLRTGRMGIFPSAYAVDTEYSEWASGGERGHRERYLLGYLGSVETLAHKGTGVVCQAVRRVVDSHPADSPRQPCILEVSDQGLRMVDKRKRDQNEPCIDYFYSLKNVSFCAFHPRDHRYLGFITKHPTLQRFACHVFRGTESTRPVAEAVGRAFQRFYQKFIETAYPVEDIYIE